MTDYRKSHTRFQVVPKISDSCEKNIVLRSPPEKFERR